MYRLRVGRKLQETDLGPVEINTDETVLSNVTSVITLPEVHVSPVRTLLRQARVTTIEDLGTAGPVIATVANPESNSNPRLHDYEDVFTPDALMQARFLRELFPVLEDVTVDWVAPGISVDGTEGPGAKPGAVPHHFYVRTPGKPPAYRRTDGNLLFINAACAAIKRDPTSARRPLKYAGGWDRAGETVMRDGSPYTRARAALDVGRWLMTELSKPGIGASLVWMERANALGNSYTTLTDSPNHFHHKDGTLCEPPVASLWIQGLAVDALLDLADLIEDNELHDLIADSPQMHPDILRAQATTTIQKVVEHFVTTDENGTFLSHAVDGLNRGTLRATGVRAVDMGMVLNTRLLREPRFKGLRMSVIDQLMRDNMLSPFGLRGRASDEARSFDDDYHGSVWAVCGHESASGVAYDDEDCANEIDARVMRQTDDGLEPEFVSGGTLPVLHYCDHILTTELTMVDGQTTKTEKEKTPAPHTSWTTGAILEIDARGRGLLERPRHALSAFSQRVLGRLSDRAYLSPLDLVWSPYGSRSLQRAQANYLAAGHELPGQADGGPGISIQIA